MSTFRRHGLFLALALASLLLAPEIPKADHGSDVDLSPRPEFEPARTESARSDMGPSRARGSESVRAPSHGKISGEEGIFAAILTGRAPLFSNLQTAEAERPPTASSESIENALERVRRANMQWVLPESPETSISDSGWDLPRIPFFQILMLLGATALVILIALLAASWFRNRSAPALDRGAEYELDDPGVTLTSRPLDLAKEAAKRGDYDEAIHLLLLGTIEEIRAALRYDVPPWLTSREIVRLAPLPAAGVPPLEQMVRAVELSHFGEAPVTKEDFIACAQWHGELRTAARGGRTRGS